MSALIYSNILNQPFSDSRPDQSLTFDMPSKRSRSKEREKKRRQREKMTLEEREKMNDKNRVRMKNLRDSLDEEEKVEKRSAGKSKVEIEYLRLDKKHSMRKRRNSRSGKEHLIQNVQAKRGMALFENEGRMKKFSRRSGRKNDEMRDWEFFFRSDNNASRLLDNKKPDIVEKINAKMREEKEKERKQKKMVEENGGEWVYSGESGEWCWDGEKEPIVDEFEYETYCEGELEQIRENEKKEYEEYLSQEKNSLKETRKLINEKRKEAMAIPVEPLPEKEPCAYELFREKNIRERKQAMADSGFFEDLTNFKSEIGLVEKSLTSTKKDNVEDKMDKSEIIKAKKEKKTSNSKKEKKSKQCVKNDSNDEVYEKEKTDTSEVPQKTSEDSIRPWHKNFNIDEWDLRDCSG